MESVSPAESEAPSESGIDLWASFKDWKDGALFLPNMVVQVLYRHLNPAEQAIYTQLFALSWGFGNPTCKVSLPKLAERSGMKQTAAHEAVKRLVSKGLVEKSEFVFGKGKDQGIEYRLPLPARLVESIRLVRGGSPAESVNNKIKALNKANKGGGSKEPKTEKPEMSAEQIQEQVNTVAGLLRDGSTIEDLEARLAGNFRPDQWRHIRSAALVQAGGQRPHPKS